MTWTTKEKAGVGCASLTFLWVVMLLVSEFGLEHSPRQASSKGYQLIDKTSGPAQVMLWVRVKSDSDASQIQDWCDDLRDQHSESGKSFMIAVYDGPKTADAKHVIGSYSDGLFIDTR